MDDINPDRKFLSPSWNKDGKWKNPTLSTARLKVWVDWAFAICWTSAILAFGYEDYMNAFQNSGDFDVSNLVFILAGLYLIYRAWQQSRAWHYFGTSPLTMTPFPWTTGSRIKGQVQLRRRMQPTQTEVVLECTTTVPSAGRDNGFDKKTIWQSTLNTAVVTSNNASSVSFAFDIPDNLPESTPLDSSDNIVWYLHIKFKSNGVTFDRTFVVPVYESRMSSIVSSG